MIPQVRVINPDGKPVIPSALSKPPKIKREDAIGKLTKAELKGVVLETTGRPERSARVLVGKRRRRRRRNPTGVLNARSN